MSVVTTVIFVGLIFFQISAQEEAELANRVLIQVKNIEHLVSESESGMRGYALAKRDSYLELYKASSLRVVPELEQLRKLIRDPHQMRRLGVIEANYEKWLQYSQEIIRLVGAGADPEPRMRSTDGSSYIAEVRRSFAEFLDFQEVVRQDRRENAERTTIYLVILVIFVCLLAGALIAYIGRKQLLTLANDYTNALDAQKDQTDRIKKQEEIKTHLAALAETVMGEKRTPELCDSILSYLSGVMDFSVASLYVVDEERLIRRGSFALADAQITSKEFLKHGEGLVGQAVKENRILTLEDIPDDYLEISSSLGDTKPQHLFICPVEIDNKVIAVIELGFHRIEDKPTIHHFLEEASLTIAQAIRSARFRERLEELLREVREQAKALQAQQEELRVSNEELEEQTKLQRESQARLEAQHAELEQTNTQLEAQSRLLELQKEDLNFKNLELEKIKSALETKTQELQQSSRYKSEFLANMSHELRTPLNSSLILAKLLADNKEGNLTEKQIEFSKQILNSGNDLLNLINDILDLSKVESGKLEIQPEGIDIQDLVQSLQKTFEPIAKEKFLEFEVSISEDVSPRITTDRLRLEQILKNLLSNAFKFTSKGSVELKVESSLDDGIKFSVTDTGIGIKPNQQDVIFEAFRQADGTTNRRFGGTGLGLSISKDLAHLLRGKISVNSQEGKGSTFCLELPIEYGEKIILPKPDLEKQAEHSQAVEYSAIISSASASVLSDPLGDDRQNMAQSDRAILIIEDDLKFAQILRDIVKEQGFKFLAAATANEGIELAKAHHPDAILLDLGLPDHSGLIVLDQLKQSADTRHIPVHVVSAQDQTEQALQMGAIGFLVKPANRDDLQGIIASLETRIKKDFHDVLIVEDDSAQRMAIRELIEDRDVRIVGVGTGQEALDALREKPFDCIIMDLNLPDISGFDLIDRLAAQDEISHPPIIVYTGRDLTREEELRLKRHSQSVIIKGAKSPERLLNEVTLFLHQVESRLSPRRKKILEELRNREQIFDDKNILVVDDDVRNIFALTSALEQKGATVIMARNGQEALERLEQGPRPDIILMDIMMPIMDGYEAMTKIKDLREFRQIPIIALTAKAMADDREKCLRAGASDYLTKPVELDKLLSLMRVWLSQQGGLSHDLGRPF